VQKVCSPQPAVRNSYKRWFQVADCFHNLCRKQQAKACQEQVQLRSVKKPPPEQEKLRQLSGAGHSASCRTRYRRQNRDRPACRMKSKPDAPLLLPQKGVPQPASVCRTTCRSLQILLPDCRTTYKAPFTLLQAFALRYLLLAPAPKMWTELTFLLRSSPPAASSRSSQSRKPAY
jgi:hypothetical protein